MTNFVIPIPPSYDLDGALDVNVIETYLGYLAENNVKTVMTTAGTSQFNMLNKAEIIELNEILLSSNVPNKIIGMPPEPTSASIRFAKQFKSSKVMVLYPDRFYDKESIVKHCSVIRDAVGGPLYLHAMFMRKGTGGQWNYTADVLNELFEKQIIIGVKEEHSNLQEAYNVIRQLPATMHVIVAGGSMRRHQFLRSAGADSFLSGIGNFFPEIEQAYCDGYEAQTIEFESQMFDVFTKYGWHPSLRVGLSKLGLCCYYDREPWPKRTKPMEEEIYKILRNIKHEWQNLDIGPMQSGE